jgi:CHAD domain-containing protein
MPFRLKRKEGVRDGVVRIVREQLNSAIAELTDAEMNRHEAVHVVRKRFKKIRAVLRLVRDQLGDVYPEENTWFRDAGRRLSAARDAEAMIETFDLLREAYAEHLAAAGFNGVRSALVTRRERIAHEEGDLEQRVIALADDLRQARDTVGEWPLDVRGFEAVRPGLERTFRRGRKAMAAARAEPSGVNYHEWRKRAKYLWYQSRVLRGVWPKLMDGYRKELHELSNLLGEDHDLVVFEQLLEQEGEALASGRELDLLRDVVGREHAKLRKAAHKLGRRIYAEKPSAFCSRMEAYWRAWRG